MRRQDREMKNIEDIIRLIGQKELVKIAVEIEISVFMAILSCF